MIYIVGVSGNSPLPSGASRVIVKKHMWREVCVRLAPLVLLISLVGCTPQYFAEEFHQSVLENDADRQKEVLEEWEKAAPQDPDLFVNYFNYLLLEASQGRVPLQTALNKVNMGITLAPDRLDLRFGKIWFLGEIEHWREFTNNIIDTIHYSKLNNNQWVWADNVKCEDGKSFFLSNLQDYQLTLYQTQDKSLLKNVRHIAEEILKLYPNHVESLSNIALTYVMNEEYDHGIEFLVQAEHIDPVDDIVLYNLAEVYRRKGDTIKSVAYYKKIMQLGEEHDIEYARQRVEELTR